MAGESSQGYFTAKDCQALRTTSASDFWGGEEGGRESCPENTKGTPEMQSVFWSVICQNLIFGST